MVGKSKPKVDEDRQYIPYKDWIYLGSILPQIDDEETPDDTRHRKECLAWLGKFIFHAMDLSVRIDNDYFFVHVFVKNSKSLLRPMPMSTDKTDKLMENSPLFRVPPYSTIEEW